MSVGQTAGSNLFVNIQCTMADVTGYVINVLNGRVEGGDGGKGACMGKDAIFR